MTGLRKYWWIFIPALVVAMIDRLTKCYYIQKLHDNGVFVFDHPWLAISFQPTINPGMAFSLPVANEIIATISFVLCVILIIWAWNSFSAGKAWLSSVIAVVMLSASSNIFDRIYWQGVIDFIAIRIGPIHWSIFNVADMGIVVGLLLIILLTTYPQINRKSTN